MALVNRDKDISEKKEVINIVNNALLATGATVILANFAFPCEIRDIYVSALGLSGSPVHTYDVWKQGNGASAFSCTGALTLQAVGTSGPQRSSMLAAGGTAVQVNASDVLVLKTSGANTATLELAITIVVQALQDIRSHFGVNP